MKKRAFSLMEILTVLMIIGVLSTIGITQYTGYRERVLYDEARSNLRLILAAEKVAFMESNFSPAQYVAPATNDIVGINNTLRLTIPGVPPGSWTYTITMSNSPTVNAGFCAQATRANPPPGHTRYFIIRNTDTDPAGPLTSSGC